MNGLNTSVSITGNSGGAPGILMMFAARRIGSVVPPTLHPALMLVVAAGLVR